MRWLLASPTKTFRPSGLTATPRGMSNAALVPIPSAKLPLPEPASVVVTPVETATWRTRSTATRKTLAPASACGV
eukprot:4646154-Prymnesium_polylepis.2